MSEQIERTEIHHRQVDLRFFQRSDGLYEIEGRLVDRKSHPFRRMLHEHDTPAGAALHDIIVRLVIDEDMLIHDASATLASTPFSLCRGAENTIAPLIGLRIGGGWNKRVRELLGGAASCTHIVEILGPMATTAFQGLAPQRLERLKQSDGSGGDGGAKVGSCFSYAAHRDVVAQLWPEVHAQAVKVLAENNPSDAQK